MLAAASVPVFGLRLGMADAGNNPEGSTTKTAYDLTAEGFGPGANGRMLIVADTPSGSDRRPGRAWSTPCGRRPAS